MDINRKVREWDTKMWKQEMEEKVSLKLYKEWRENIGGQDNIYDNREAAAILFRCRTNNIDLGDRKRFVNGTTECIMCGAPVEDLKHFILFCIGYNEVRSGHPALQQPYQENTDIIIGQTLFDNSDIETTKDILYNKTKKEKHFTKPMKIHIIVNT